MKRGHMKPGLKKYLLYAAVVIVGGSFLFIFIQIVLAGYSVAWTGFGAYTSSNGDVAREKTLWDWMELLIIPLVLAGGAFYLQRSERAVERQAAEDRAKLEREIATDRQQEAALQAYLDRMAELLLEKELRTSENEEVRNVARTRTLTVLRGLDSKRKELVVHFLHESGLISQEGIVDLTEADLHGVDLGRADLREADLGRTNLAGANLAGANLAGANLSYADLRKASLKEAQLRNANLSYADLSEANLAGVSLSGADLSFAILTGATMMNAMLIKTNLRGATLTAARLFRSDLTEASLISAHLFGADLGRADLHGADLSKANLSGTHLTDKQLANVKSLKGATMPDGTINE